MSALRLRSGGPLWRRGGDDKTVEILLRRRRADKSRPGQPPDQHGRCFGQNLPYSAVLRVLYFVLGSVDVCKVEGVVQALDGHRDGGGVDAGGQ